MPKECFHGLGILQKDDVYRENPDPIPRSFFESMNEAMAPKLFSNSGTLFLATSQTIFK